MPFIRIAAAAVLASAIATSASANILANGSFELGTVLAVDSSATGPLTAWTVGPDDGTSQTARSRGPISYPGYPVAASDGEYFVALNASPDVNANFSNWISQGFSHSGASVAFSFDMSTEGASTQSTLTIDILDQTGTNLLLSSDPFTNSAGFGTGQRPEWDSKTWTTTLAAGDYVVRFRGVTDFGASDVLLDNVALTSQVPAPASALVLASALGMLGLSRRRRRTA